MMSKESFINTVKAYAKSARSQFHKQPYVAAHVADMAQNDPVLGRLLQAYIDAKNSAYDAIIDYCASKIEVK